MSKRKHKWIIFNIVAIGLVLVLFFIININIDKAYKQRLALVADSHYCYGIDSLEKEGDMFTLKGWFFELKSIQKVLQNVSAPDAELMVALVPVNEAVIGKEVENAVFMDVVAMHEDRSDVNEYFACEFDYSQCGFVAKVNCSTVNLPLSSYQLVFKPDANNKNAVLSNVYLTDKGLSYTDPAQSPELDTVNTDLDRIMKEGVRLVSRPEFGCYVYQLYDKLYWIADDSYEFSEDGNTFIEYQMNTTQIDNLPAKRLENNWFWSNIGDAFEEYEITKQINCGKYRVSVRDIPKEYSITDILTGYYNGDWVWKSKFKPVYAMLM